MFFFYICAVKLLSQISVFLVSTIFMLSSSGYVVYKTHCSCMGEEQVSVFVAPETCEANFHQHYNHEAGDEEIACSAHQCHDCTDHTDKCGCAAPLTFFFKLNDQVVGDGVKFLKIQPLEITVADSDIFMEKIGTDETQPGLEQTTTDPPVLFGSTLDFLIELQQLKIPNIA